MKKIILAITVLFSLAVKGQNIDTVRVRNLTLQAQDWAWLTGKQSFNNDSLSLVAFRKVRSVIQANIPGAWTTNVTVDSLPGRVVMALYQLTKDAGAGQIAGRYAAITNAISAKTNLTYWVGKVDTAFLNDFINARELGKHRLIDQ